MSQLQRRDWFPTPIWEFDVKNSQYLNQNLLLVVEEEQRKDPQGLNRSNKLGWHSATNLHQKPELQDLISIINNQTFKIIQEQKWDLANSQLIIDNCWAMVNYKYGFSKVHSHSNSIFSGVYYISTPEESGNIFFIDPRPGKTVLQPPLQEVNLWTTQQVSYQPRTGMMLIFPSWLWHGVEPNLSNQARVSISFNLIWSFIS